MGVMMAVFLFIYAMSIIGFFIHIFWSQKNRDKKQFFELLILYQLVVNIGVLGFISAMALLFMPKMVADHLGWPTCPFQHELGNVNLAFSMLAFMSIWFRGDFWTATIFGVSIWLIGDGIGHLWLMSNQDDLSNNLLANYVMMVTDFIIPITLLILLLGYKKLCKEENKA